ncbi:pirin family protein [Aneurinibacillus sp. REN35]|uniref:pirin family protein n=1 Tax=Aneurinibacillus sp. REN35 TaxID=3237286 RepID=UPI003528D396
MKTNVYPPSQQAFGAFDGGKITEQKPIGFPGEGSAVQRVGPLFYWSWFHAPKEGFIPAHPHQGFEILTYVVHGKAEHSDSLGTKSVVGIGGVQVMQTGSGVYHEERMIGPDAEGFQIWFEPHLKEAFKQSPTYHQMEHEDFPAHSEHGVHTKTVIGQGSPVSLTTDAKMWDVHISAGQVHRPPLSSGYTLAALTIKGSGIWYEEGQNAAPTAFTEKDFTVLQAESNTKVVVAADAMQDVRLILVEVPIDPGYPLYPAR